MGNKELRVKIYERLGLEFGSLPSESGNDWERAKKEVLEEEKQQEYEASQKQTTIDLKNIDKNNEKFQQLLNSSSHLLQDQKIILALRKDLDDEEMMQLLETGSKEVYIAIATQDNLSPQCINKLIKNGVYQVKKILAYKYDTLPFEQKEYLVEYMQKYPDLYKKQIEILDS